MVARAGRSRLHCLPNIVRRTLFAEHWDLAGVGAGAFAAAVGGADYGEDGQGFQGAAGDENSLGVRAQVGGVDQKALGGGKAKVIWHHAFQHFVILKLEADPQALGAGTGGKSLAAERVGIAEFADEINRLDVPQIDGDHVSGGVQQLQLALADEVGRGNVSVDRIPVHLADYDFFVG